MRLQFLGKIHNGPRDMSVRAAVAAGWPAFAGYAAPCGHETWVTLSDRSGRRKTARERRAQAADRLTRCACLRRGRR